MLKKLQFSFFIGLISLFFISCTSPWNNENCDEHKVECILCTQANATQSPLYTSQSPTYSQSSGANCKKQQCQIDTEGNTCSITCPANTNKAGETVTTDLINNKCLFTNNICGGLIDEPNTNDCVQDLDCGADGIRKIEGSRNASGQCVFPTFIISPCDIPCQCSVPSCPSDSIGVNEGTVKQTCSGGGYKECVQIICRKIANNNGGPIRAARTCSTDTDCAKVEAACNCNNGGRNYAINKNFNSTWQSYIDELRTRISCTTVISTDTSCLASVVPVCNANNLCVLRRNSCLDATFTGRTCDEGTKYPDPENNCEIPLCNNGSEGGVFIE